MAERKIEPKSPDTLNASGSEEPETGGRKTMTGQQGRKTMHDNWTRRMRKTMGGHWFRRS